jgi:hypothetical protein
VANQCDTYQLERQRIAHAERILEAATTAQLVGRSMWLDAYLEDEDSQLTATRRRRMLQLVDQQDEAETALGRAREALAEARRIKARRHNKAYRQRQRAAAGHG